MEGEYQKLAVRAYPARSERETPEGRYWRRFKSPSLLQQVAAVTHIDFCPTAPYNFAATSSTRVLIYDSATKALKKTITRFQETAYGGVFRSDGRAVAAGCESGVVQLFDVGSRTILRQFKGHKRAAHTVQFSADKLHVLSGSDDTTVRLWDATAGTQVTRLTGHTDYVRSSAASPSSHDVFVTGSFDHSIRLWDVRQKACVLQLPHGAQVEDVCFLPGGGLLATAGGSTICIWDILGGGRLLRCIRAHAKEVTCLCVGADVGPPVKPSGDWASPTDLQAPRLLSGSLDGHVKIFDLDTFQVTHATQHPAPVLSLGISGDGNCMAVGMATGLLSIRRRAKPRASALALAGLPAPGAAPAQGPPPRPPRYKRMDAGAFRFFIRGRNAKAAEGDHRHAARKRAHLSTYDKQLRRFHYRDALDAALLTRRPEVVASVLEELAQRGGLPGAVSGRDPASLLPLIDTLARYITAPRYARLFAGVVRRLLDVYAPVVGADESVDLALQRLRERVALEVRLQEDLMAMQGMLENLLTGAFQGAAPGGGRAAGAAGALAAS